MGGTRASQTAALMGNTSAKVYKGEFVFVKELMIPEINWRARAILKELKLRRDMQNDNILAFIGACVDPPDVCLAYPWVQKGSLDDVLQNTEIHLDFMFKTSIGLDICSGLKYIQKVGIGFHGNLKSVNCMVDNRWNVKLSNFGLREFCKTHYANKEKEEHDYAYNRGKLWTAPELLRQGKLSTDQMMKCDIYSLGIILHEVMFRMGPYGKELEEYDPSEVLEKIKNPCNGTIFRPSTEECPEKPGTVDVMNNMIKMLEKYATNLEGIVAERTEQLAQEKKK